MLRFLTAGESHGQALVMTLDGMPAGLQVDVEALNAQLKRRQGGYGRGRRMQIESDRAEILSGVFEGVTTGAPISLITYNGDVDSSKYENLRDVFRPGHADYTFDAKYVDGKAVTIDVPAKLQNGDQKKIRQLAVQAFQVLKCEDYARVDMFYREDGSVFINEINTIPGFTNSSMYPMMWNERGISFTDLITRLIDLSIERCLLNERLQSDYASSLKY